MEYMVSCWCGVPQRFLTEERIAEARDAGITVLIGEYDAEHTKIALEYCRKCGIRMMITDCRISQALQNPALAEKVAEEVCADWKDDPALYGYFITDEPGAGMFGTLAAIQEAFRKCDPVHPAYINLFPNYACEEQLGTPTYEEHVERFLTEVRPQLLSWDHYHFLNETPPTEKIEFASQRDADIYYDAQKRTERAGFFDNLEICRKHSLAHSVPYMLIVLLVEHGPYRYLSRSEIAFEVYQALAYGCSAVSYFTYWTPQYEPVWHYRNGMISENGERCRHYDDVAAVNAETRKIGEAVAGSKSSAVFHVGEEAEHVVPFTGYGGIEAITGGRFTVGFFEDGMLLIANKDFDREAEALLTTERPLAVLNKQTGQWEKTGNRILLAEGSGALLRIL